MVTHPCTSPTGHQPIREIFDISPRDGYQAAPYKIACVHCGVDMPDARVDTEGAAHPCIGVEVAA